MTTAGLDVTCCNDNVFITSCCVHGICQVDRVDITATTTAAETMMATFKIAESTMAATAETMIHRLYYNCNTSNRYSYSTGVKSYNYLHTLLQL